MTHLSKFTFKSVTRHIQQPDPVAARRTKIVAAIDQQKLVLAAAVKGETYTIDQKRSVTNDAGETVQVIRPRTIRPWFFVQDDGWYVQCRYGLRVLLIDGKHNAVFAKNLTQVAEILDALRDATLAGDLDQALALTIKSGKRHDG